MRRSLVSVLVLGVLAGGTACTAEQRDHHQAPTSSRNSLAPAPLHHAVGARADVRGLRCAADRAGDWTASGTVRNTTRQVQDYAVSVYVADRKNGAVVGHASRVYHLTPGATSTVSFKRFLRGHATKELVCVPNVRRGTA